MNDRDKLLGYPCNPLRLRSRCTEDCLAGNTPCERRDVYRAHIALRADMRKLRAAVLGDMTPKEAAKRYQVMAHVCEKDEWWMGKAHFEYLADVVEGLDA